MLTTLLRRFRDADPERGTALIAAVAVALIGMALASVVMANAITTANESGADRARTTEVHSAEGAVDALYAQLEAGTPCTWPASGGSQSAGTAPTITYISATVNYYDKNNNALTCSGGTVTGAPTTAVITATSRAAGSGETGGGTSRSVQSKVQLTPNAVAGTGSAIFAANQIMTTNNFTLTTSLPDTPVDVWVDSGNVDCNSNVTINGNLIVVNGTTSISGGCRVAQNLWSKKKLTVNTAQSAGLTTVGGDTWVSDDATLAGGSKYGGNVTIAGAYNYWTPNPVVAGALKSGVGTAAIPQYLPVGLPKVTYKPSDWTGFVNTGDRAQAYKDWIQQNAVANGAPNWSNAYTSTGDKCDVAGDSWSLNGPLLGPTVATVFDTRFCAQTKFEGNLNIKLRADLVIFADDFYATGNFQITSADGNQHNVWIIVPDPNTTSSTTSACGTTVGSYKSGNVKFDSGSLAIAPITFFAYTPCTIDLNNTVTFYGQLYGGTVNLRNAMTMQYVPIGIPGVTLPSAETKTGSGYRVDIVYKREIKNP